MGERPIRILLVDDHTLFRRGLRQLLTTTEDLVVVGEATSGAEALVLASELAPDVVLMDIAMPDLDGIAAAQALRERYPNLRIVMLTMYDAATHGEAARNAGAVGYVVKSSQPEELFQAIRAAANGTAPSEPTPPSAASRTPSEDRLTYLEARMRWLEEQLAALAARAPEPTTQPSACATERPVSESVAAPSARSAPAAPRQPLPRAPAAPPDAVATASRERSAERDTHLRNGLALVLVLWVLAGASVAWPGLLGNAALWVTLGTGLLASGLLVALAQRAQQRPTLAHLLLLLALASALGWTLATAILVPHRAVLATSGLFVLALAGLALAWRRAFLLAAVAALASMTAVPLFLTSPPPLAAVAWVTSLVGLASASAWTALGRPSTVVAWEWLPLAPLTAGLPWFVTTGSTLASPARFALLLPWLAAFPALYRAARVGRASTLLMVLQVTSASGTFAWFLRGTEAPTQASALVAFAAVSGVLAVLLWRATQQAADRPLPAEILASFSTAALLAATIRHPEPALFPLASLALAVLSAAGSQCRVIGRWAALGLLLAGGLTAATTLRRADDPARIVLLSLALAAATASGPVLIRQPWWHRLAWLTGGAVALAGALVGRTSAPWSTAGLSLLALATLAFARSSARHSAPAAQRWFWLPAATVALLAIADAIEGPLSPTRLGLDLRPSLVATSEPVVTASILVATALVAGRVLGRRWRGAAIAVALLIVAYTLPAVLPDAALVVSWLALAVALAHTVGDYPARR